MVRVHEGDVARTRLGPARPVRTCVGCRHREPSSQLLRVVAVGDLVVLDARCRLPGRGAWLHPDLECLRSAERRRAFPRALRVHGPLDTSEVHRYLEQQLHQAENASEGSRDIPAAESTGKQVDPS